MTSAALRRDEDEAPVVATARAALYSRLARDLDPPGAGWRTAGMEMP